MEGSSRSHSHNASAVSPSNNESDVSGVNGSVGGAKYRLMSPAKLPISRSAGITIPPGLSPTSFLESPVLLSNMKAEPSPTTGSFFKPQSMQSSMPSMEKPCLINSSTDEETVTGSFEFRFHTGPSSTSGLPSPNSTNHAGSNRNAQLIHQDQHHLQPLASSSSRQDPLSCNSGKSNEGELDFGLQASYSENKDSSTPLVPADRTSEDGYNWRKYGQKLVKGSEFPRSYYKCTYPNCEVKKIFERSPSGQITEIIYKGSHDHPKPQPARRNNPGAFSSIQEDKLDKDMSFASQMDKMNGNSIEQNGSPVLSPLRAINDGGDGSAPLYQSTNDNTEDDPYLKRRRLEDDIDITPVVKPIREPRVVVQTVSEVDILDDGYRWRKYGQKVVRGNPNPRSYYKCTFAGCPVRKHVERASHDPRAVITTYEGKHSHDVPIGKNSNGHELASTVPYNNSSSRIQQPNEVSNSISLDLGVGMSNDISENKVGFLPSLYDEAGRTQIVLQPSQIPMGYGRF